MVSCLVDLIIDMDMEMRPSRKPDPMEPLKIRQEVGKSSANLRRTLYQSHIYRLLQRTATRRQI